VWEALGRRKRRPDGGLERSRHTFGGASNIACSSLMRFDDPLTRKVPSTSVPRESKAR
jgi:hypothetical protein